MYNFLDDKVSLTKNYKFRVNREIVHVLSLIIEDKKLSIKIDVYFGKRNEVVTNNATFKKIS